MSSREDFRRADPAPGDDPGIDWHWRPVQAPEDFQISMAAVVGRHTPPGTRVLEVGVGSGYLLSQLHRRLGCRCVGLDILASALVASRETARHQGSELWLVQGSGFALPFLDGSFDIVMSMGVIEHFPEDRTAAMLREHARVCRSGGRVIVSVPNGLDVFHTLLRGLKGRSYPYYPERSYTPWGLGQALRGAGLEPTDCDGYAPLWSYRQHWLGYPLIATLYKTGLLHRLNALSSQRAMSWIGNMTVRVGVKRPVGP